ncbi:MAG: fasciclin domain-containing protein, partial [Pirellulales bacterium]|nr:fasciclin domain-containing protein [Pirellulales bacterium]
MSEFFEKVPVSATILIAFAMAFGLLAERSDAKQKGQDHDIVRTASEADSLKTLVAAVQAAGLVDALKGPGPFTVFAPADAAFAQLPEGTLEELLKPENKKRLVEILTYHVIPGKVTAAEVAKLSAAETLNGQRVDLKSTEGKVTVDGTRVVAADIECSNGIVHVIDQVLIPSSKDLVETAAAAGDFNTLLAAAQAANLAGTLQDGGPFTVLAPTDEAFKKLPPGTIKSLLKTENQDRLVEILKYHVIPGRVYSDAALKAGHAKSLQG